MWTWEDVDEAYLERMVDDYPFLVQYVQAVEAIHGKAMMSYITYMIQRIIEMHRVLKPIGSLYLHCDPTASHYLKIILDRVFGHNNFRNEIIWYYKRWTAASRNFQRMHDIILWYSKSDKWIYNKLKQPFSQKTTIAKFQRKVEKGRSVQDKSKLMTRNPAAGVAMHDVWEVPFLHPVAKERLGYPTQKPLALLRRIIEASSNKGDVILDPFAGCATTCVAAQQLERKWIGIDIEKKAAELVVQRLSDDSGLFSDFMHRTDIPKRTDIKIESENSRSVKERLFKVQEGLCNGCDNNYLMKDLEVDHIVPRSKGGGDYYENYQLLCGNCNRIKGDAPMDFFRSKMAKRAEHMKHKITFGT